MGRLTTWKDRILPKSAKPRTAEAQPNKREAHPDHTPIAQESAAAHESVGHGESNKAQSEPSGASSADDLWECAFEQLDEKERDELRLHSESSSNEQVKNDTQLQTIVEEVIKTTQNTYEEYQKKGGIKIKKPAGGYVDLRKVAGKVINAALSVQDFISKGVACDPTGHAASAWAVVSLGLTMTQNHNDRRDALFNAVEYLVDVLARCTYCEVNFLRPQGSDNEMVRSGLIRVYKTILQYTANVKMAQNQQVGERLLDSITSSTSQQLGENQSSIEKAKQDLYQLVQWDSFKRHDAAVGKILTTIDDKLLKSVNELLLTFGLPIAEGAVLGFYENQRDNGSTCLEETRVDVLSEISDWAESPDTKFFWLNGMAGTGKSTLARTVAESFQNKKQLGAAFFFKKDDAERGNAKRFISTIAKQLMGHSHQLASQISEVVNKDSQIASKALSEQFRKLLFKPLQEMTQDLTRVIVIVVDALDECIETDLEIIFKLLPELQSINNIRLKIFLTGRPERQIFQGIEGIMSDQDRQDLQDLALHQVEESIIEHDIRLFLRNGLEKIRKNNNSLRSTTWPADDIIEKLVRKSVPLFIYAATVCRFIGDGKQLPQKRLDTILQSGAPSPGSKMQVMYQAVLEQLLDPEDETESKRLEQEFKDIVGVVILLAAPLSVHALGGLLPPAISAADVGYLLDKLRSVLSVPADDHSPVSVLHESFREFLLRPGTRFFVDTEEIHGTIVSHCLHAMNQYLKRDICNLQHYGIQHAEIKNETLRQFLPSELQYSCRYWVYHLERSRVFTTKEEISESDILGFLQRNFLHWLEAMTLMGIISETVEMVDKLQSLKQSNPHSELSLFLFDAKRFILRNIFMAETAPLQLYCSGLIFSPRQSIVRKHFEETLLEKLHVMPCVEKSWSADLQTIQGCSQWAYSVAFSPDGQIIASGLEDKTIKLWETRTGQELQTLHGHSDCVQSVAFSPDGQLVASGSSDGSIKLWDSKTGQELRTLQGHSEWVQSVAFSPDSQIVVSGSSHRTIKFWDTKTGQELHTICHSDTVQLVVFSPDGQIIASGSDDNTIKLWGIKTGQELQTLCHSDTVQSVAFSPDGQIIASGSHDGSIKLWDTKIGKELRTIQGHPYWVYSVAFSPDGQTIASGSANNTIKLWETRTGQELQIFHHSYPFKSVAFSSNDQGVVLGSDGRTIKLWDTKIGQESQILRHSGTVKSVAFSPNGQVIASSSEDRTIKLWDTKTGKELQTLQGHSDWVNSVAFSPLSPDGEIVVSGSDDGTLKLWDTRIGQELRTIQGHSKAVLSVAFSPDGQIIASSSTDFTIKLWDTKTDKELHTLKDYRDSVRSLVFSPDSRILGTLLPAGGDHKIIELWDVETGRWLRYPEAEADPAATIFYQSLSELDQVQKVSVAKGWVAFKKENLIWLPADYRNFCCSAIQDGNLALGYPDGRVLMLGFRDV
ncbi:hypothetical protein N7540_006447 [Penicillium herquei]|nr:hypothetical protein N7540_006447 [Penicillium herquei]